MTASDTVTTLRRPDGDGLRALAGRDCAAIKDARILDELGRTFDPIDLTAARAIVDARVAGILALDIAHPGRRLRVAVARALEETRALKERLAAIGGKPHEDALKLRDDLLRFDARFDRPAIDYAARRAGEFDIVDGAKEALRSVAAAVAPLAGAPPVKIKTALRRFLLLRLAEVYAFHARQVPSFRGGGDSTPCVDFAAIGFGLGRQFVDRNVGAISEWLLREIDGEDRKLLSDLAGWEAAWRALTDGPLGPDGFRAALPFLARIAADVLAPSDSPRKGTFRLWHLPSLRHIRAIGLARWPGDPDAYSLIRPAATRT